MTDEKLDAYTQLLKEQVADLEVEVEALPYATRYHVLVQAADPFEFDLQLDGATEARRLDDLLADMSASLVRLTTEHALQEVREAIQLHRRATRIPF
jgi:hypothetical protein